MKFCGFPICSQCFINCVVSVKFFLSGVLEHFLDRLLCQFHRRENIVSLSYCPCETLANFTVLLVSVNYSLNIRRTSNLLRSHNLGKLSIMIYDFNHSLIHLNSLFAFWENNPVFCFGFCQRQNRPRHAPKFLLFNICI